VTTVVGTRELVKKLQRVNQAALGVVTSSQLQDLLVARVRARFDAGVAPDGSPWPGLMEETIKRKRRSHYGKPQAPLQATGRLRKSIGVTQSNIGILASATGLGFRIGIRDAKAASYGRLHNYGLGGQEKRQFIGLGALDVRSVRDFLNRNLKSIAEA